MAPSQALSCRHSAGGRSAGLLLALVATAACASNAGMIAPLDTSSIPMADPGSKLPEDWQRGAFIEIYVRGYKDSDGDGIGDLRGLTQSLDYLRDLGVTGIWLMPINSSQDHDHGYAVTDYRDIEPKYGTLADFDELLAQAHARGIGIIIDYVMNHSGSDNPAFVYSRASPDNPFRSWYVWLARKPSGWTIYGNDPWYASSGSFYFAGFTSFMPDFNLREPAVVAYHQDSMRFWLNRGVDGFRFDAVANLIENGATAWEDQPESRALMGDVRRMVGGYARRYIVCEAPPDPAGFASDAACGSAFAFGHQSDLLNAARGNPSALLSVAAYGDNAQPTAATFLANHDSFAGRRIFTQLNGDLAQYKLAAATNLLQPGIPFLYYGEEIGMADGPLSGDWGLRTPMSWTGDAGKAGFTTGTPFRAPSTNVRLYNVAAELDDPASLLNFYKAMLGLRRARPSIARGAYEAAVVDGSVMSFRRVLGGERTLVVINYGSDAAVASVAGLPRNAGFAALYPAGAAEVTADASGNASVPIAARSVAVFAQR